MAPFRARPTGSVGAGKYHPSVTRSPIVHANAWRFAQPREWNTANGCAGFGLYRLLAFRSTAPVRQDESAAILYTILELYERVHFDRVRDHAFSGTCQQIMLDLFQGPGDAT